VLFFILKQFHIKRLTVISKMPVNDHRLLRLLGMFASKVVKLKFFFVCNWLLTDDRSVRQFVEAAEDCVCMCDCVLCLYIAMDFSVLAPARI